MKKIDFNVKKLILKLKKKKKHSQRRKIDFKVKQ